MALAQRFLASSRFKPQYLSFVGVGCGDDVGVDPRPFASNQFIIVGRGVDAVVPLPPG